MALRHPLRRRILRTMANGEPISPRQLSRRLHQPLSSVSYHVRVLFDRTAIDLVRVKPVRGSIQHFYRNAVEEDWAVELLRRDEEALRRAGENPDDPEP